MCNLLFYRADVALKKKEITFRKSIAQQTNAVQNDHIKKEYSE